MKILVAATSIVFALTTLGQQFVSVTNTALTTDAQTSYPCIFSAINSKDSFPDLFVGNADENSFYHNISGNFTKIPLSILPQSGFGISATVGDYNNDGFNDLFISQRFNRHFLLKGNAGGFSDENQLAFTGFTNTGSFGCSWIDYNNDGWLDLIVVVEGSTPRVYKNSNGVFNLDYTPSFTQKAENYIGIACADYDKDGDQDVFLVNHNGKNALYQNDGNGKFTIVQSLVFDKVGNYNGASWGDADNDGDLDLFVTAGNAAALAFNQLFINNGDGTFSESFSTALTSDSNVSMGSGWADADNDGDLDLVVVHSSSPSPSVNTFYKNNGSLQFIKEVNAISAVPSRSRGLSWADYNNDGFLDLFVANEENSNNFLFKNITSSGNWLKLRLEGVRSNKSAIGAKVLAISNGSSQIREISAQTGYCSQNDLTVHFGMGNNTCTDSVVIYWPSGQKCVYTNLPVNRFYFISENCENLPVSLSKFSLGNDTTLCPGNELLLNTKDLSTIWNNGQIDSSIIVKDAGTYIATITGYCGLTVSDTIEVNTSPPIFFNVNDTSICETDSIVFNFSNADYSFQWSTGNTSAIETITNKGTYFLTVTNQYNCNHVDTFTIGQIFPPAELWNFTDTSFCLGQNITLHVPNYPFIKWSDGLGDTLRTVEKSGIYAIEVANNCGQLSDSVTINFAECKCELNMPNAFSPNGDNVNDFFGPVYDCPANDFNMTIFNRWGEKVFETNNINHLWDGTFNGKELPIGVFIYKVSYTDAASKKNSLSGKVILIR